MEVRKLKDKARVERISIDLQKLSEKEREKLYYLIQGMLFATSNKTA